jgi:RNA polymerase sigma-70 factor (ECF subfamily)
VCPERTNQFSEAIMPHIDALYRAAVALAGHGPEAEDLVQATMLKALRSPQSFQGPANCKAWLLRILRNTWFDVLRRKKTVGTTVPVQEELLAAPEGPNETVWSDAHDLLENFSDAEVITALAELPDEQRLTLYLVDVEQLDQQSVAEITGVPVGTVKSRTNRARTLLRGRLEARARDLGFLGRT